MLNINYQLYESTKLTEALLIKNKNKNRKGKRKDEIERGTYPFLIISSYWTVTVFFYIPLHSASSELS